MDEDPSDAKRLQGPNFLGFKSRYQFDDYDYSPSPPGVEGEFLHLRFQQDTKKEPKEARLSVFDQINQELGYVGETKTRKCSVTKADRRPSLTISKAGISLTSDNAIGKPSVETLKEEHHNVHRQKIILDPSIGRNRRIGSLDTSAIQASCLDPSMHFPPDSSEALDHTISVRKTIENISSMNNSKDRDITSEKKSSIYSPLTQRKLINLPISRLPNSLPDLKDAIPAQSLNPVNKVMDRNTTATKSHVVNYFFTGGSFFSATKAPSYMTESAPASLSVSDKQVAIPSLAESTPNLPQHHFVDSATLATASKLQNQTQKIEEGEKVHESLAAKGKYLGRRPKPSSLREMNCWAPQSM